MISVRSAALLALVAVASFAATAAFAHSDDQHDHTSDVVWHFSLSWAQKQNKSAAVADCFCWNTTSDTWCHHELDGPNTGFWRDSCQRVIYYNYFWVVFALLWVIWLALVPVLMFIFRCICNCCGGRKPSYGCCCPYSNSIMSDDPRFIRPYSRCATYTAKILAFLGMAAVISLSVHCFIANHRVSKTTENGAQAVGTSVLALKNTMFSAIAEAGEPSTQQLINETAWLKVSVASIIKNFDEYQDNVQDILNDISDFQTNQYKYRANPTLQLVAIPLAFVCLLTLLAVCNARGCLFVLSAMLISIVGLLVVIAGTATLSLGIAADTVCDNADSIKTFTKQILTGRGCEIASVTQDMNSTDIAFVNALCKAGLDQEAKSGVCGTTPAKLFTKNGTMTIVDLAYVGQVVSHFTEEKSGSAAAIEVSAVWSKFHNLLGPSSAFSNLYYQNYDCNIVDDQFNNVLYPALCQDYKVSGEQISLAGSLNALGSLLFGLALCFTLLFWVWWNGSKRFTKASSQEEIIAAHRQCVYVTSAGPAATEEGVVPAYSPQYMVSSTEVAKPAPPLPLPQQSEPAAVAAATEQPLLLSHQTPNYSSAEPSVNNKEQPAPL